MQLLSGAEWCHVHAEWCQWCHVHAEWCHVQSVITCRVVSRAECQWCVVHAEWCHVQSVSGVSCMQSGVTCRVSVMFRACRVVSRAECQ